MTQQVKILAAKPDDPSLSCEKHVVERADSSKSSSSLPLHAVAWSTKSKKERKNNKYKYIYYLCLVDFVAMEVSDRDGQLYTSAILKLWVKTPIEGTY